MIVLPLVEGDNTDLEITAMDSAGNETASGPSFSWMESNGRTRVFSFEDNIILFGNILTPILS